MVTTRYRRSPFCLLHWEGNDLVVLNCNRFRMFRGAERYVAMLHQLGDWTTAEELAERLGGGDEAALVRALERLVHMELVVSDPPGPADEFPAETRWNLIDLAMQRQSARGGFDPASLQGAPPPAFKSHPDGAGVALPDGPLDEGHSFASVLERRRSRRTYADGVVSLEQLGTFLASSARVQRALHDPVVGDFSQRPYPSGGARHPLEIYPVCNAVGDLDPGPYWYDPRQHRLYPVGVADAGLAQLNAEVRFAAGDQPNRDPPVVFVITAVFARTMWKYDRIGLSVILKDLGGLYQTMHLVATAMELAGCPLGAGRESENARWLGLDPLMESQVGAFLLGRPQPRPGSPALE